jgi:nicotinamide mononucleotide transporter
MLAIEIAAVICGLLCVWLTIRQSIWCWPTGLVQVALYIFVFQQARLYSDMILHIIYVVLQVYGWRRWARGGENGKALAVSRLSPRALRAWMAVTLAGALGWGWAMSSWTDAALPYGDAFVMSCSLVAQWLMTRKKLESWHFWIAVDVVSIGIYLVKSLHVTTGLYAVFLGLAIAGAIRWRRAMVSTADATSSS